MLLSQVHSALRSLQLVQAGNATGDAKGALAASYAAREVIRSESSLSSFPHARDDLTHSCEVTSHICWNSLFYLVLMRRPGLALVARVMSVICSSKMPRFLFWFREGKLICCILVSVPCSLFVCWLCFPLEGQSVYDASSRNARNSRNIWIKHRQQVSAKGYWLYARLLDGSLLSSDIALALPMAPCSSPQPL